MPFGIGPSGAGASRGMERPHADRILRRPDGEVVLHWAAEDPKRRGLPDLGTERQALDFLRSTKDPAVAAGTLRRFLRSTWIRTADAPSPEARKRLFGLVFAPGLLSPRETEELLVLVAAYVAEGKLRVERLVAPPGGWRSAPQKAEPEKMPPTMAMSTRTVLTWIGIELVDADGNPVAGEEYEITLPDGSVRKGTLDDAGKAHERGIDPGTCAVRFPALERTIDRWVGCR